VAAKPVLLDGRSAAPVHDLMIRRLFLALLALGALGLPVAQLHAQDRTITGRITDEQGSPVAGVSDAMSGTQPRAFSGPDGACTITARGDITVVSTTATNRPFLDNTANR
jgi:hypothetical protein